jgi:hypothetical protein
MTFPTWSHTTTVIGIKAVSLYKFGIMIGDIQIASLIERKRPGIAE